MSSTPRVLIVDDEERFRSTMCRILNLRGLDTSTAGSGNEALEKLQGHSYDVLVLDIKMPDMGGIQVLAEARKVDPSLEVIVMTGYASLDTAREITKLGAYDYLLKPYNTDELVEKIEGAYDRKTSRAALAGQSA